jgi:hypothetical protein
MTLDRTDGYEEPRADLGVGQMFAERGQDLGLTRGDADSTDSSLIGHAQIVHVLPGGSRSRPARPGTSIRTVDVAGTPSGPDGSDRTV